MPHSLANKRPAISFFLEKMWAASLLNEFREGAHMGKKREWKGKKKKKMISLI